ncbi:hypothetical protein ACKI10_15190 [Streptomyces galilaeus]|uniref:Uncharacterized protein n=1 Tax=Streptomyces galilaeus TaxID=33899 RepID=A0ABW9IZT4_STRGJ
MRRDPRLEIITKAVERLIPRATPAFLTVTVTEMLPGTGEQTHTWTGKPEGVAVKVFTALYGRPSSTPDTPSPLAQAEDAKRAGCLVGEIAALTGAHDQLTSAAWYPARPGDLVHIHYPAAGKSPAFGETYIVGDAGDGLMSMQLLAHTLPDGEPFADGMVGCFAAEAADDPLYEAWFEAGPHLLTIVRDGRPVHSGGVR